MNSPVKSPPSLDGKERPLDCVLDQSPSTAIPENSQDNELSDEAFLAVEKSLVRKLDSTLMPTVFVLYLFNYLDRNNIAYVATHQNT